MEELRLDALDRRELVDVRADLQHGARLHVPGQLRVRDLVVPRAEGARASRVVDAEEEVRVAAPGSVEEGRLVDHVRAARHRAAGLLGRLSQLAAGITCRRVGGRIHGRSVLVDAHHAAPGGLEVREVATLVLQAPTGDQVDRRVVADRLLHQAREGGALQLQAVRTGQEPHQVGGRVDRAPVDALHAGECYGAGVPGCPAFGPRQDRGTARTMIRYRDRGGPGPSCPAR